MRWACAGGLGRRVAKRGRGRRVAERGRGRRVAGRQRHQPRERPQQRDGDDAEWPESVAVADVGVVVVLALWRRQDGRLAEALWREQLGRVQDLQVQLPDGHRAHLSQVGRGWQQQVWRQWGMWQHRERVRWQGGRLR